MTAPIPVDRRRPVGALAWRQYRVPLLSGQSATIGLSLGDPRNRTMATLKRSHDAAHVGLLVVLDDPGSPEEIVVWLQQATTLTLISRDDEAGLGPEITGVLPRYFAAFFDDIKDIAPDLAGIRLAAPRTLDRTLN
ncbi:MAG: hypothetical protein LCH95_24055 [Proteobacteria bacterium]|nr:hypothetical protein [Pseudomonadota bacterium]